MSLGAHKHLLKDTAEVLSKRHLRQMQLGPDTQHCVLALHLDVEHLLTVGFTREAGLPGSRVLSADHADSWHLATPLDELEQEVLIIHAGERNPAEPFDFQGFAIVTVAALVEATHLPKSREQIQRRRVLEEGELRTFPVAISQIPTDLEVVLVHEVTHPSHMMPGKRHLGIPGEDLIHFRILRGVSPARVEGSSGTRVIAPVHLGQHIDAATEHLVQGSYGRGAAALAHRLTHEIREAVIGIDDHHDATQVGVTGLEHELEGLDQTAGKSCLVEGNALATSTLLPGTNNDRILLHRKPPHWSVWTTKIL